jgi:hypothetical protein
MEHCYLHQWPRTASLDVPQCGEARASRLVPLPARFATIYAVLEDTCVEFMEEIGSHTRVEVAAEAR